jgi:hypothetical protein
MKLSVGRLSLTALVLITAVLIGSSAFKPAAAQRQVEPDLSKTVEALLAKEEIRQQIYNYSRGLDRMDKDLALQVWHPDGTADYGGQIVNGRALIEGIFQGLAHNVAHAHHMVDTIITVDGNKAVSETYANSSLVIPLAEHSAQGVRVDSGGVSVSLIRGRYADRWSKRDGDWALDHRAYIEDFRTVQKVPGAPQLGRGTQGRSDLSYSILAF